jgi:hypothetical protein
MKEPKEILKLIQHAMFSPPNRKEQDLALLEVIRQIQIESYNEALEACAELVEIRLKGESQIKSFLLDGGSILKLKK